MNASCSQSNLLYALNIVNKAISPNHTLPVLNNILIKANNKKLFLSATNLEIAISCDIEASLSIEGSVTVPAKLLTNYISLLNDEEVQLKLKENLELEIKSSKSNTKIKCISADEFPLIPKIEKEKEFKININDFYKSLNETVFSASINTTRPVLSGVFMKSEDKILKIVATDSYRLAEKKMNLDEKIDDISCIVPAKTMVEISRILSKAEEKYIKINISKNQILFSVDGIELISRLIEGNFPEYEKIIPQTEKTRLTVSKEDLILTLKRVSLFARENNNSIKLEISKENKMTVSSEETKIGEEKADLGIECLGEDNEISLNSQYLLDVLNIIDGEKVDLILNERVSPVCVKSVEEDGYIYIIMPLKA